MIHLALIIFSCFFPEFTLDWRQEEGQAECSLAVCFLEKCTKQSTEEERQMLKRYTREGMGVLWTEVAKFLGWTKVEVAAIEARIETGEIRAVVPAGLFGRIQINPEEINQIESKVTKHDVIAYLKHVSPQFPEDLRPWLHHKMTSYDTQDTALFVTLVLSLEIIIQDIDRVLTVLRRRSFEFKNTPMIGRTHGIHAEPITFGVKLAKWHDELKRQRERLMEMRKRLAVGKISGAVGLYTLDPDIEKRVCGSLGLRPVLATQIISRDIIAEYLGTIANIAGSLGNFATNIRGLARTEIREVMEYFDKDQRGSSAMPHKKNPIISENVTSLCRYISSLCVTAFQNQITWDERDLANSANERIILPDASITIDFALNRFAGMLERLVVFPKRMMKNIRLTKGLVYSQDVQALVAERSGLPREDAYGLVREVVLRCWESDFNLDFYKELMADKAIMKYVSPSELKKCFELEEKIKHVDHVFEMAFGSQTE